MLMREVDEAVRQDQATTFARKYGWPIAIGLVLALALFGGYLFWQNQSEGALEGVSENYIAALDEADAGNFGQADEEMAALVDNAEPGAAAAINVMRAAIAIEDDAPGRAVEIFREVAANSEAPDAFRELALIRAVTLQFEDLEPEQVIEEIGPLANADSPWFGSAGELVAMAYLEQGDEEAAGQLLVEIAQDDTVPASIRARTRQVAGVLGYDAIEDVEETLREMERIIDPASGPPPAP